MTNKQANCPIFNGRIAISLAVLTLLLLSITTITTAFVNSGNFALAQSQSSPSISANLNDVRNNNTTTKQVPPPQQPGQQQQNLSSLSSISQQPQKIHEYTLIAENTTLEIAPGLRVDAWTYNGTIPGPTLTATEGDRVIIHFINKTPLPHTIHLHGDHPSKQDSSYLMLFGIYNSASLISANNELRRSIYRHTSESKLLSLIGQAELQKEIRKTVEKVTKDKAQLIDTSKSELITIDEKELGKYIDLVVKELKKDDSNK